MKRVKPDRPELARNRRLFDDGIKSKALRKKLKRASLARYGERRRPLTWTEKLCVKCRKWNRRDDPENWCECFKEEYTAGPPVNAGPAVQVFQPFYHPNIQPLGAWIKNKADLKEAFRLNHKEPAH